eukprot:712162-Prymnesium_polylepis.1
MWTPQKSHEAGSTGSGMTTCATNTATASSPASTMVLPSEQRTGRRSCTTSSMSDVKLTIEVSDTIGTLIECEEMKAKLVIKPPTQANARNVW